jgi:single-strand DNA-binding protein
MNFNKVTMVGRLTRDPILRSTPGDNSKQVCNFSIAVNRQYGKDKDQPIFIDVQVWNKLAENVANYVVKGQEVLVDGRLEIKSYPNKEHPEVTMKSPSIVANDVQFGAKAGESGGFSAGAVASAGGNFQQEEGGEIPF